MKNSHALIWTARIMTLIVVIAITILRMSQSSISLEIQSVETAQTIVVQIFYQPDSEIPYFTESSSVQTSLKLRTKNWKRASFSLPENALGHPMRLDPTHLKEPIKVKNLSQKRPFRLRPQTIPLETMEIIHGQFNSTGKNEGVAIPNIETGDIQFHGFTVAPLNSTDIMIGSVLLLLEVLFVIAVWLLNIDKKIVNLTLHFIDSERGSITNQTLARLFSTATCIALTTGFLVAIDQRFTPRIGLSIVIGIAFFTVLNLIPWKPNRP